MRECQELWVKEGARRRARNRHGGQGGSDHGGMGSWRCRRRWRFGAGFFLTFPLMGGIWVLDFLGFHPFLLGAMFEASGTYESLSWSG